eukprot:Selendium_serpulae@DN6159_c2_g1_i12.p1
MASSCSQAGPKQPTSRSRPVDFSKPLLVIRTAEELKNLEGDISPKPIPTPGRTKSEGVGRKEAASGPTEVKDGAGEDERPAKRQKKTIVVPLSLTTRALEVEKAEAAAQNPYLKRPPFVMPEHYIRHDVHKDYVSPLILEGGYEVLFDLVYEDETFLELLQSKYSPISGGGPSSKASPNVGTADHGVNDTSANGQRPPAVTDVELCRIMNELELQTGRRKVIPIEEALRTTKELLKLGHIKPQIVKEIYNHWNDQRLGN